MDVGSCFVLGLCSGVSVVTGWVFVKVSGWLAVACRVVQDGSQWVTVGRRGVGSRWVVGLGCGVALSLSTSHCHNLVFFLNLPDLLDF